jgi:hypothetical protein
LATKKSAPPALVRVPPPRSIVSHAVAVLVARHGAVLSAWGHLPFARIESRAIGQARLCPRPAETRALGSVRARVARLDLLRATGRSIAGRRRHVDLRAAVSAAGEYDSKKKPPGGCRAGRSCIAASPAGDSTGSRR